MKLHWRPEVQYIFYRTEFYEIRRLSGEMYYEVHTDETNKKVEKDTHFLYRYYVIYGWHCKNGSGNSSLRNNF